MNSKDKMPFSKKVDTDRLGHFLDDDSLSLDLVSAYAGDRPMTDSEKKYMENLKNNSGEKFYSDLLYKVTHHPYSPKAAKELWERILKHKYEMSSLLKRNIRITVAALDYLSNLTSNIPSPTVIDEAHIADIIRLARRDGLTGLFNHAYFYKKLEQELKRYARYGTFLSLMMMDIDNFKMLNDQYGHQEGDRLLVTIAAIIEGVIRDSDTCCRYGGEEFAVILPSTDAVEAKALAHRIREKLAQSLPENRKLTVSIGVASCSETIFMADMLVKKADEALYQAKNTGKDCVVVWQS